MPWSRDITKTDGTHETFEIPRSNHPWFHGVANSSPKSSLQTTTVEQVKKMAEVQEANTENKLGAFGLKNVK